MSDDRKLRWERSGRHQKNSRMTPAGYFVIRQTAGQHVLSLVYGAYKTDKAAKAAAEKLRAMLEEG